MAFKNHAKENKNCFTNFWKKEAIKTKTLFEKIKLKSKTSYYSNLIEKCKKYIEKYSVLWKRLLEDQSIKQNLFLVEQQ